MARPMHRYKFAEYLELEEFSDVKHEYFDGEIFAMAGGTPEHAALAAEVIGIMRDQLRGSGCRVYSSDLRVRLLETGLATYPDATIVCGPLQRDPDSPTHVVNPTVVVEVLSDSTEHYDRTEKLDHYQRTASVQAVVIVAQTRRRIDVWSRDASGWSVAVATIGQTARIPSPPIALHVDALYDAAGV